MRAVETDMDITEALAFLDAHYNFESGVTNDVAGIAPWVAPVPDHAQAPRRLDPPSLERMRRLLVFLGDPQLDFPILHITGTNGKGSTARMAASLLHAAGHRVGTYTSPHLQRLNERIAMNGKAIDDTDLAVVLTALELAETAAGERCSFFELITAAAYRYFGDEAVEAGVIEVGAGGRWDATNTADGIVSVITNVELDHMEWFGNTKAEIAREKVGIVKPGATAIIGDTDPDIVALLERESLRLGAERVLTKGFDFACDSNRLALAGRVLTLRTPTTSYSSVFVPLHGSHQGENATTALVAVETFLGAPLEPDVVLAGFAAVENPGRMEVVSRGPLVLLDGAHNPAGARTAAVTLSEEFAANPGRIIVIGLLKGRDPGAMLDALEAERAKLVIVVTPPSPRAMAPDDVVAAAMQRGIPAIIARTIANAIDHALEEAENDDVVLITGSLYLVGAARAILKPRRER